MILIIIYLWILIDAFYWKKTLNKINNIPQNLEGRLQNRIENPIVNNRSKRGIFIPILAMSYGLIIQYFWQFEIGIAHKNIVYI